jgi:ureidoglycolate hydrolase
VGFLKLPAYSPDIHKVIEHVHGTVYNGFMEQLMMMEVKPATCQAFIDMVGHAFTKHVSVESVQKDIASLKDTLTQIVLAQGGWPSKKYR